MIYNSGVLPHSRAATVLKLKVMVVGRDNMIICGGNEMGININYNISQANVDQQAIKDKHVT